MVTNSEEAEINLSTFQSIFLLNSTHYCNSFDLILNWKIIWCYFITDTSNSSLNANDENFSIIQKETRLFTGSF